MTSRKQWDSPTVLASRTGRLDPSRLPIPMTELIYLLLLVDTELARAAVDKEQKTADDGEDLEKVVLGKILVRMVLVKLE